MKELLKKLKISKKNQLIIILILIFFTAFSWVIYIRKTQVMPQSTIYFMDNVTLPNANQRVLIFSPHPDDETISVGGYIKMSKQRHAAVHIVLVTDGDKRHLEKIRYQEFRRSTSMLGLSDPDLIFLNYPDGRLATINYRHVYQRLQKQIAIYQPDIIIYPNPADTHPDHATTGKIVQKIILNEKLPVVSYEYLVHHPRFPQPKKLIFNAYLLPPVSMATWGQKWQRLLLPKEVEQTKYQALLSYRSQLRVPLLRSLMLSSIRQNELFSKGPPLP